MSSRFRGALVASTLVLSLLLALAVSSSRVAAEIETTGTCSGQSITLPFSDVPGGSLFFCAIAGAYFSGLVNGTSATSYNPSGAVTRDQMSAFVLRTQDSAVRRASRRAALEQWAIPKINRFTSIGAGMSGICSDGEDLWVGSTFRITRVHASDGKVLGSWNRTAGGDLSMLWAAGFVYAVVEEAPGKILRVDPQQAPGDALTLPVSVGDNPRGVAFDGINLWTANHGSGPGFGSITAYNTFTETPTSYGVGFDQPSGILFDGTDLWVVDQHAGALLRVKPETGGVIATVSLGSVSTDRVKPVFDGANIWVVTTSGLKVVRTSTPPVVLATLTGNGLPQSGSASFDGERVLVVGGLSVSLWKASNLTPLGSPFSVADARGVASDGLHFFVSDGFFGGLLLF